MSLTKLSVPEQPQVPVISAISVVDSSAGSAATLSSYREMLDGLGHPYEVLWAIDGRHEDPTSDLHKLQDTWPELTVLYQRPWLDEDAALHAAVKRSEGEILVMLAGWPEVEPNDIEGLIDGLKDHDMVIAARRDQKPSWRNSILQRTLRSLFGSSVRDVFCRTRVARKTVLEEVSAFGVRQHFLPTIASALGYSVNEVDVDPAQTTHDADARFIFKPLGHIRAFFDALTLFLVLKFLRRPLRFFGAVGLPIFIMGTAVSALYLGMRLFGDWTLADRPGLIFGVLMVVLGLQIIALGLVGEIIIFANSRRMKQYTLREIIRKDGA